MPRALTICSTPGCGNATSGGRCDECRHAADLSRGTAAQRGYGARWRKTRAAYLAVNPLCSEPECYWLATDVDHIDGLGPNSPHGHDWNNLRGYCHSHHSKRTATTPGQEGGWNRR